MSLWIIIKAIRINNLDDKLKIIIINNPAIKSSSFFMILMLNKITWNRKIIISCI